MDRWTSYGFAFKRYFKKPYYALQENAEPGSGGRSAGSRKVSPTVSGSGCM